MLEGASQAIFTRLMLGYRLRLCYQTRPLVLRKTKQRRVLARPLFLRHLKPNSNILAFPNYFNRIFVIRFQLTFINKNCSFTSRAYIAAPSNEHGASRGLLFRILFGVFLLANYWIAGWPLWAFSAFRSLVSLMSSRTCSTISTLNKTKTARVPSGHQNTATFLTSVILFEVCYC